jgi:hypothetical protein
MVTVHKYSQNRYACGLTVLRCGLVYALFLAIVVLLRIAS